MFSLITGGSASGKSAFAEDLVMGLPGRRIYLAAMERYGAESLERIEKHRNNREGKQFVTIERTTCLEELDLPADSNVLLECLGTLTANEMFMPSGGGPEAVIRGIDHLLSRCSSLTIVANEVFSGGGSYGEETLRYMRELGRITCLLAARADYVCEIVCGVPNVLKDERGRTGVGKEKGCSC